MRGASAAPMRSRIRSATADEKQGADRCDTTDRRHSSAPSSSSDCEPCELGFVPSRLGRAAARTASSAPHTRQENNNQSGYRLVAYRYVGAAGDDAARGIAAPASQFAANGRAAVGARRCRSRTYNNVHPRLSQTELSVAARRRIGRPTAATSGFWLETRAAARPCDRAALASSLQRTRYRRSRNIRTSRLERLDASESRIEVCGAVVQAPVERRVVMIESSTVLALAGGRRQVPLNESSRWRCVLMTTMMCSRVLGRAIRVAACVGGLSLAMAGTAMAQTASDPNPGALTFTGVSRCAVGLCLPRHRAGIGSQAHVIPCRRYRSRAEVGRRRTSRASASTSASGTVCRPGRRDLTVPAANSTMKKISTRA